MRANQKFSMPGSFDEEKKATNSPVTDEQTEMFNKAHEESPPTFDSETFAFPSDGVHSSSLPKDDSTDLLSAIHQLDKFIEESLREVCVKIEGLLGTSLAIQTLLAQELYAIHHRYHEMSQSLARQGEKLQHHSEIASLRLRKMKADLDTAIFGREKEASTARQLRLLADVLHREIKALTMAKNEAEQALQDAQASSRK